MRVNSQENIKYLKLSPKLAGTLLVLLLLFISPFDQAAQNKKFTVVLDPGHGGKDPGTMGTKRYKNWHEKNIVLSVALKEGAILKEEAPDISVIYTRKTDVFVELHKRGEIANKADADLFISIHVNAASASAKGTETYLLGVHRNASNLAVSKLENDVILLEDNYEKHYSYNPNNPESIIGLTLMQEDFLDQSIKMAKILEKNFVNVGGRTSKGVKQAGFVVLHQSYMPAILTEIGFLSNTGEEDFLRTDEGQEKIAQSLAASIIKYKNELTQNGSSSVEIEDVTSENKVDDPIIDSSDTPENKIEEQTKDRIFEGVTFKIQIASGVKSIETKSQNFKGLKGVERIKTGSTYKYYFGKTSNYDEILKMRGKAKEVDYSDCFIVAFKNGEKVSVTDVINERTK